MMSSRTSHAAPSQLVPCIILSKSLLFSPVVLRRASSRAALFGSAISFDIVVEFRSSRNSVIREEGDKDGCITGCA